MISAGRRYAGAFEFVRTGGGVTSMLENGNLSEDPEAPKIENELWVAEVKSKKRIPEVVQRWINQRLQYRHQTNRHVSVSFDNLAAPL